MFQYTEPLYSASNDPIKPHSFTATTTRPGQHYPYDPEFYHNSTAVSWQPPTYSEVQPIVDYPGSSRSLAPSRPRITTSLWDDEGTVCYQVDVRGICVARRQDNDMINGTKLLNVTGMSRGKRDGILKNEKGRVVVKVGAMHLKGVWVTFARAKALAIQYTIVDYLYPLFVDDPAMYFYSNQLSQNYFIPNHPIYLQSQDSFTHNTHSYKDTINNDNNDNTTNNNHQHCQHHHSNENTATNTTNTPTQLSATSIPTTMTTTTTPSSTATTTFVPVSNIMNEPLMNYPIFSNDYYLNQQPIIEELPPAPSVPSMLPYSDDTRYYA